MSEQIVLDPTFSPMARTNLAPTPNPDLAFGAWSSGGAFWNNPSTLTRDTSVTAPLGLPACLKSVANGAAVLEGIKCSPIVVTAGAKLRISAYVRGGSGGESVNVGIGDGTVGSASTGYTAQTKSFQRMSFVFTPKASGSTSLGVVGPNSKTSQTFYVAAIVVEVDPGILLDYFPTPLQLEAPLPTDSFTWDGSPYESTSTYVPLRTEFDITPWIGPDGVDWGDAEIEAYKAQAQIGESVVDYRLPNRPIGIPLVLKDAGGTIFDTARSYFQAKAALWQREGGIAKRILPTGGTVYFDVVSNGLTLSGGWLQAQREADNEAELRLEAIPDFYEPEVELTSAEEKTAAELIKVIPDPGGDMPARVRIVVEEKQGQNQLGLIWALRSRHYSSAVTAKPAYEAEELQALDAARKVALSGASGGTVVQHGTIATSWTPVVGGRLGGTAFPTHTGTNRVFARVYSTSGTLAQARLVWDVGDMVNPVENAAYRLPGASNFHIADLGEVRLDKPPVGTHRWDWQIQAMGDVGTEDFKADKVWIVNCDESMGRLTAPIVQPGLGLSTYSARSEFNIESGVITGDALTIGGTWVGAGDADDFSVAGGVATRSAVKDLGGVQNGRLIQASAPTLTAVAGQIEVKFSLLTTSMIGDKAGLLLRYVDASNLLAVTAMVASGEPPHWLVIEKRVAGSTTTLKQIALPPNVDLLSYVKLAAIVTTSGQWAVFVNDRLWAQGEDASLATGGPLDDGKVGIVDHAIAEGATTRTFDNFAAWAPNPEAVVFASRSAQLTTDGMYRLDPGGSAYGPVSRVVGDLPRLPAGGLENRPTELFMKASRGDLGELPDSAIDDGAVKVFVSRSWLTVPGTI